MGHTNYLKLKDAGDAAERSFIDFLDRNGFTNIEHIDNVWKQEGLSLSDWDVRATNQLGITVTYEVKGQDRCHTFGMHNVEQVQYGKPGGIAVSKADVWVFVNPSSGLTNTHTSALLTAIPPGFPYCTCSTLCMPNV